MAYMEINFLAEIIAFERWLETNDLPSSSQLLWYKMMTLFNRSGWSEWVIVDNLRLMATMSMGREATLIKARDELIKAGRIIYQKGRKGSPNKYKMVYFTFKNVVQSEVYPVVQSEVKEVVKSEVQSADIYKQKQKQNEKKDTKVSKEKRFTPPSVEAVAEYCQKRGNNVDPQRFVDFYQAKGWMVGNNRMTDWQAAVRTWEQRDKTKDFARPGTIGGKELSRNQFHNFSQRDTDYDAIALERARMRFGGGEPDGGEKGDAG